MLATGPTGAQAAPTCGNLNVRLIFYSGYTETLGDFNPDGCWNSRRLLQDKNAAGNWVYTICHPVGALHPDGSPDHPGGSLLALDDTRNDSASQSVDQEAVQACPGYSNPYTSSISLEYMAAAPETCSNQPLWCWGFYYGQGTVSVARFYPELYVSQTVVQNLDSAWDNNTYNASPSNSAATINISPFLDFKTGEDSLFAKWDALQADVYDVCRATQGNYLSIYFGYINNGYYEYPTSVLTNGEGYYSAEEVIARALNACV